MRYIAMKKIKLISIAFVMAFIVGCASSPKIGNETFSESGKQNLASEKSEIDIDSDGNTPLMRFISANRTNAVKSEIAKEEYFDSRRYIDFTNKNGDNALHLAVKNGNEEILSIVAESGIELDTKNKDGFTPLHLAVLSNNESLVQIIISKTNCGLNTADRDGKTPLILAAAKKNLEIISILQKAGANGNLKDRNGKTYRDYLDEEFSVSSKTKSEPTLGTKNENQVFTAPTAQTTQDVELNPKNYEIIFGEHSNCKLILAVLSQDFLSVQSFLRSEKEKCLEEKDSLGNSPLMYATVLNSHQLLRELLLSSRQWVNVPNIYGQTPLMASLKNEMTLSMIMQNSPNVNARDTAGNTALSIAVMNRNVSVAKRLVQHGASTSFMYEGGNNILQQAVINGDYQMVSMLLKNLPNIDMSHRNSAGKTALELAEKDSIKNLLAQRNQ